MMQSRKQGLLVFAIGLTLLQATACGGESAGELDAASGADAAADAATEIDAATTADASTGCPRSPGLADRVRKVVVSHPFDEGGGTVFEVLELSTSGEISTTGVTFDMHRSNFNEIVFTPDGEVGIVAHDDGTLGVFRFDASGAPVVVHEGYDADGAEGFYATGVVVMADDGAHAYVLSTQWREHGGGIHRVAIACDGSLSYEGNVAAGKLPGAFALVAGGQRALVAAKDIFDSSAGDDVHLLDWAGGIGISAGADSFPDDDFIVAGAALTADGNYWLVGDNNGFYGSEELENRVAVVEVGAQDVTPVQTPIPVEDPVEIVTSPDDDAAIVVSGFGDAIFALAYDSSNAAAPFGPAVELSYTGGRPQLPGAAGLIERGTLRGRVLVAENVGIRQVQFEGGGVVTDLGAFSMGSGSAAIVGALGVQP